ncbi:LLM class flavin-dependent oxidoreductase [Mycobacterium talmoniae]|uniref:Phthiodiolone/phenolphthiodiolone dimycocerosates ketoreductase n=1 Tax=Mycobacterium talmoniae TaxID=1858794 RepID=A0A2S8BFG6_9MYCO|nr:MULTISPECIES: LLM class flavin-dependent oxidoreductase [Mycobacterium]PQM45417.1 Phthiodiolone/phenolphthiodiolone dimycocerosates ketoreductase [Mycobacterium talmoniae]
MLETCVGLWTNRYFPAAVLAEQSKVLQDSGVVDGVLVPDQLAGFLPRQLWREENTPIASIVRDPDSAMDAFMVAPYIYAAAPRLNMHLTTDSIRRAPSELIQSMLTLAHITEGHANFQIGGGEVKQTRPFGHPYKQGMSRMRDLMQIYRRAVETDGPFDYAGERWTFENAFLGNANEHLPTLWGLGGGPRLTDCSTSFADGMAFTLPGAFSNPDQVAEAVGSIRKEVEQKGRDPEAFRIGLWAAILLHPDQSVLEKAFDNPLIKFFSAANGRVESRQWQAEGLPLPFPQGWAYYKDLLPNDTPDDLVDTILAATTREHVERSWFAGSPADVAAQMRPYLEAGIDWVLPFDYLPVVGDPADAPAAVGWMVDLCRELKSASK